MAELCEATPLIQFVEDPDARPQEFILIKFFRSNIVTPCSVGAPYTKRRGRLANLQQRRAPFIQYDAFAASALFCMVLVAFRGILLSVTTIKKDLPETNDEISRLSWLLLQEIPIIWTIIACIIQFILCIGLIKEWKWFKPVKDENGHCANNDIPIWHQIGIVSFGLGSIGLYISIIYDHSHCLHELGIEGLFHKCEVVDYVFNFFFVLLQSFYLWKTSVKKYEINSHPLLRYAYVYLAGTNIMMSFYYVASEIREGIVESVEHPEHFNKVFIDGEFSSCKTLHHTKSNEVLWYISSYIKPFVIEFNLLAVEILLHQWSHMTCGKHEIHQEPPRIKSTPVPHIEWSFASSGLLTCAPAILIACYDHSFTIFQSYFISDSLIKFLYIVVIIYAFHIISDTNSKQKTGVSGVDILLMLSGLCYFSFNVMLLIADIKCHVTYIQIGETTSPKLCFLILEDVIYCVFIWLQTTFVLHIQRYSENENNSRKMKHLIMILGTHNIFRWAKMSFIDLNIGRRYPNATSLYGEQYFNGCFFVFFPIGLFYYFQSAIILARYYNTMKSHN